MEEGELTVLSILGMQCVVDACANDWSHYHAYKRHHNDDPYIGLDDTLSCKRELALYPEQRLVQLALLLSRITKQDRDYSVLHNLVNKDTPEQTV
ncbi:hypothetical protein D1872_239930 [compost metagenome]